MLLTKGRAWRLLADQSGFVTASVRVFGELDDGKLCSVIYMKKTDGRRVSFDDDTRLNLEPRAYKLGNVMKKPTVTTRKDAEKDERPVEEN